MKPKRRVTTESKYLKLQVHLMTCLPVARFFDVYDVLTWQNSSLAMNVDLYSVFLPSLSL